MWSFTIWSWVQDVVLQIWWARDRTWHEEEECCAWQFVECLLRIWRLNCSITCCLALDIKMHICRVWYGIMCDHMSYATLSCVTLCHARWRLRVHLMILSSTWLVTWGRMRPKGNEVMCDHGGPRTHMNSSLDMTWCRVRIRSEHIRLEISRAWHRVECNAEQLVKFLMFEFGWFSSHVSSVQACVYIGGNSSMMSCW